MTQKNEEPERPEPEVAKAIREKAEFELMKVRHQRARDVLERCLESERYCVIFAHVAPDVERGDLLYFDGCEAWGFPPSDYPAVLVQIKDLFRELAKQGRPQPPDEGNDAENAIPS